MNLKTAALATTALLALASSSLAAEAQQIWGGGEPSQSSYSGKYVPAIIEMLERARMSGYSWAGVSQGTAFNAEAVTFNPTNLAVGQYDLLKNMNGKLIEGAGRPYAFQFLFKDLGPECLYLVTQSPHYETWGHVVGNAWQITVATGGIKSGSYGTLQVLMDLYPDLGAAKVENIGSTSNVLAAVADGKAEAGFFVMRPDPESSVFETIKEKGLNLVPVIDYALEGHYDFKDLKVSRGGVFSSAEYHTTACTTVSLITGVPENLPADDVRAQRRLEETVKRVGSLSEEELRKSITERFSSWRDYVDSFRDMAADRLGELKEQSKVAFDEAKKLAR